MVSNYVSDPTGVLLEVLGLQDRLYGCFRAIFSLPPADGVVVMIEARKHMDRLIEIYGWLYSEDTDDNTDP